MSTILDLRKVSDGSAYLFLQISLISSIIIAYLGFLFGSQGLGLKLATAQWAGLITLFISWLLAIILMRYRTESDPSLRRERDIDMTKAREADAFSRTVQSQPKWGSNRLRLESRLLIGAWIVGSAASASLLQLCSKGYFYEDLIEIQHVLIQISLIPQSRTSCRTLLTRLIHRIAAIP